MKKVIVTGAAGYLGSCITKRLLNNDYVVLCIIRDGSRVTRLNAIEKEITIVTENDRGFESIIREFNADIVIHTACRYQNESANIIDIAKSNLYLPLRVLELTTKESLKWINTATALNKDVNLYSLSKWQFCEWGKAIASKFNIKFYNIIPELFYGPDEDKRRFISFVIESLKTKVELSLTKGKQLRDIIYIDDLVEAFMKLFEFDEKGYWDIPVGVGASPSIREIVMFLKDEIGSKTKLTFGAIPERENEPQVSIADTRILTSLGWEAAYSWKDGLRKMVAQLEKDPVDESLQQIEGEE